MKKIKGFSAGGILYRRKGMPGPFGAIWLRQEHDAEVNSRDPGAGRRKDCAKWRQAGAV